MRFGCGWSRLTARKNPPNKQLIGASPEYPPPLFSPPAPPLLFHHQYGKGEQQEHFQLTLVVPAPPVPQLPVGEAVVTGSLRSSFMRDL